MFLLNFCTERRARVLRQTLCDKEWVMQWMLAFSPLGSPCAKAKAKGSMLTWKHSASCSWFFLLVAPSCLLWLWNWPAEASLAGSSLGHMEALPLITLCVKEMWEMKPWLLWVCITEAYRVHEASKPRSCQAIIPAFPRTLLESRHG